MATKADIKALRAGRRAALVEAGALMDAYRSTRSRVVPSGKTYRRKSKYGKVDV